MCPPGQDAAAIVASTAPVSQDGQTATEVYMDGKLYNVDKFKHPGGTIIKFFMGTGNATDAFEQMHIRSKKARKVLASLPSRPAPLDTVALVIGKKEELAKDFAQLQADLKADGFFKPHMGEVIYRLSEIIVMFAIGFSLFLGTNSWTLNLLGLIVLGVVEGRCGWLMHEGGHGSLTGDIKMDRCLQIWLYGLGCGMPGGWWRSNHNKHHAAPQKLEHDGDLETLPLVAFHTAVTKGVRSPVLRAWLRAQAYLFMPVTCCLVVLGWQFFLHPRYMFKTSKWQEMITLVTRYYLAFTWLFAGLSWSEAIGCYVFVQQMAGSYIFTNFAMSHTHLDVTQPDEHIHWCHYASDHTVNISNHWFVNWWMANLNFQIEHHLFPAMPQFRHPQTSVRVQALFKKHGLVYDTRGFFSCLGDTLNNLHDVGHSVPRPQACKEQ